MRASFLVVEDEPPIAEEIVRTITQFSPDFECHVANSQSVAFELLARNHFDFIILDLNIPTTEGKLDSAPAHGFSVFTHAQAAASGTPILVLTGSSAEDFIPDLLRAARQIDVWGEGTNVGTVDFLPKYRFNEFPSRLEPRLTAIRSLGDIELDKGQVPLTLPHDRLIRIFARRFGGKRVVLSVLGGGLSGALVLRLKITDAQGTLVHDAVAKLGTRAEVAEEGRRFDTFVSRLDPRSTPRKLPEIDAGAGSFAGVFYTLAARFERTAFVAASGDPSQADAVVRSIEACTHRWIEGVQQSRRSVKEVRRALITDEACSSLATEYNLGWIADFEQKEIQTRWCCTHGDLHGENVLIANDGSTVVIDYGDVGEATASLDPVTLELSLLFHPSSPLKVPAGTTDHAWPTEEQARNWGNLDQYLVGCPSAQFVRSCRDWSVRAAAGQREVAATAYAYLIRQLKYKDTNKQLVLALLTGVRALYEGT